MTTTDLLLRYSHNVVEHLGLKLYQNRPTRVIAEIVSNSWDADARRVQVNTSMGASSRWVAVLDDGCGMSRDDLASSYLVIGRGRRRKANDRSRGGRRLMGRKGIGKLAPFGIARIMDVVTVTRSGSTRSAFWLRFDLSKLLQQTDGEALYRPRVIVEDGALEELPTHEDATGQVDEWRTLIEKGGSGTAVVMTRLSLARAISNGQLLDALGRRFTVAVGQDIAVSVNGEKATVQNTLPEFEFRIPESGKRVEEVGGKTVSYWIGFVKSAEWPQDRAGVGVYAHGKIAQDRPFTFGVKGKEIFTRYMFGVVVAEWLDELEGDVISTDRTSINWEASELQSLFQWGQKHVRNWVSAFEKWREKNEAGENRRIYAETRKGAANSVTEPEREEIIHLVSTITPAFGKDVEAKRRLVNAVSDAWVQKPMRRLVRDLWESVGRSGGMPPAAFASLVERLSAHSVPESLNLAVVFAQRAFALTRLHDYVHHGSEMDLQKLLERFPWIVEPDLAVLTANQQLKTAVRNAEKLGQIPTGRRVNVGGVPEVNKPDFVFLSSPCDQQIVVVELKNPQADLTIENRAQLQDYLMWLEGALSERGSSRILDWQETGGNDVAL